jgi:hypothetical protein
MYAVVQTAFFDTSFFVFAKLGKKFVNPLAVPPFIRNFAPSNLTEDF